MEEQKRQRKDSKFKNTLCVANFNVRLVKKDELGGFYMPDKILESSDSVIFFESSSTGDRKSHIGELFQFLTYVNNGIEVKNNIYFVLFLCGDSKSSPNVKREVKKLRYYYQNFSMKNNERAKIKGIFVSNQQDITDLSLEKIKKFDRIYKDD